MLRPFLETEWAEAEAEAAIQRPRSAKKSPAAAARYSPPYGTVDAAANGAVYAAAMSFHSQAAEAPGPRVEEEEGIGPGKLLATSSGQSSSSVAAVEDVDDDDDGEDDEDADCGEELSRKSSAGPTFSWGGGGGGSGDDDDGGSDDMY